MKVIYTFSLYLLVCSFAAKEGYGQSLAYKALLKSTYDQNFDLVYPEQKELINNAIILDTREANEFKVSHLKGAQWVGYETFDISSVKGIPKDSSIVVYCSIGARSQEIGKILKQNGYNKVYNLYGGIFHWVNENNPVFQGDTLPTNKVHTYNKMWGIWLNKGEKVN